jgi:2-polyprenyl-6-hydroxyphenyl methylase/3-demethylubiquinone-9 3-methyltransferase
MRDLATLAAATPAEDCSICKCCGESAPKVGTVDFNKCCEEINGLYLPASGIAVTYYACNACGFLFTRFFDGWAQAEFGAHIYNDGYLTVDPSYAGKRPNAFADSILQEFGSQGNQIRFLDWGAGAGILAQRLREGGFLCAEAYDPFGSETIGTPDGRYNFVGCFEVMEHVVDPRATVQSIAHQLEKDGLVLISTLVQGEESAAQGLKWWYFAPRNGHISIYSKKSLHQLWTSEGFHIISLADHLHMAWKSLPTFAAHLSKLFLLPAD